MANRERIESAVAESWEQWGVEISRQEIKDDVSLLVRTIVDGLRKGYVVTLIDQSAEEGVLSGGVALQIVDSTGKPAGSSASQDMLEEQAWMFLERNLEKLSEPMTDLAFIEGDIKSGQTIQLYFPLDELDDED